MLSKDKPEISGDREVRVEFESSVSSQTESVSVVETPQKTTPNFTKDNKDLLEHNRKMPKNKKTVFVFETDIGGTHRTPSAKNAIKHYGAIRYRASGKQGKSYGVPLYGYDGFTPLSAIEIREFILEFADHAAYHEEINFKIGALGQMMPNKGLVAFVLNILKKLPSNCYLDTLILNELGILNKQAMH